MAISIINTYGNLDSGLVLTPERYRNSNRNVIENSCRLIDICSISTNTLPPKKADNSLKYLVLDTGDVKEGFIKHKEVVTSESIGSTKKILRPGDVIISRLRPYLRQVGYVDEGLISSIPKETTILCSTEFYVLRADYDLSFLTIFLLSEGVQQILNGSQEGGHHPRFNVEALSKLAIDPVFLQKHKDKISSEVKGAISMLRDGEQRIVNLLGLRNFN